MGGSTGPCGPVLPLCPLCPLFPLIPLISRSLSLLSSSLPPRKEENPLFLLLFPFYVHVVFVTFYFYLPTLGAVSETILFHPPLRLLPPHQGWIPTQLLCDLNPPLPVLLLPDQFYLGVHSYPHLVSEGVAPLLQFLPGVDEVPQAGLLVLGLA